MKKSQVKPKPTAAIRKADKILRECSADARFAKVVEAFNNGHNCPHCATAWAANYMIVLEVNEDLEKLKRIRDILNENT